jgi:hypothetical protein
MGWRGGYVRLYRKLLQNSIWTHLRPAVLKVAIYFLLRANYESDDWYDGLEMVKIPAGSFVTSYATVVADCGLSHQQVRDAFGHLERTHFATYRRTPRWTLVTVRNWDSYQADLGDRNTAENTLETGQRTTDKEEKKKTRQTPASPGGDDCESVRTPDSPQSARGQGAPLPGRAKPRAASQSLTAEQEAWFAEWWAIYWRRAAREDARKAFGKHVTTEERFRVVMAATRAQKPEMLARPMDKRPYPATWLNGERWQDEIADQQQQPKNDDYQEL